MDLNLFLLILITFNVNLSSLQLCGTRKFTDGFIFGGSNVKRGQWPWMGPIFRTSNDNYHCGSTLISEKHSLTAAHCIHPKDYPKSFVSSDFYILFGGVDTSKKNDANYFTKRSILSIKKHPDWSKKWDDKTGTYDADLAILKFQSVTFNDHINKICLPTATKNVFNVLGTITGYGFTKDSRSAQTIPQYTQIHSVTQETCFLHDYMYVTLASERTFCAGDKGKIPCRGDSGGGFVAKNQNSRWTILGIVSSGIISSEETCDESKYAIFTNVVKFLDWINENIQESLKNTQGTSNNTQIAFNNTQSTLKNTQVPFNNATNSRNFVNYRRNVTNSFNNGPQTSRRNFNRNQLNYRNSQSPNWSQWSEWSPCNSTSCEIHGYQSRNRTCLTLNCFGDKNELKICRGLNCQRVYHYGNRRRH